jgi:hypothetical protein
MKHILHNSVKIKNLIWSLLLICFATQAQISNVSTTGVFLNNSNSVLFALTNTSGANKLLIVSIAGQQPSATSTVTFNGLPLLQLVNLSNPSQTRVNVWYLANPPIGTYNIVVNNSQNDNAVIGATVFTRVNAGNPFGSVTTATGNSTTATVNTILTTNQLRFSLTAFNNGSGHKTSSGLTELGDATINNSISGSINIRTGNEIYQVPVNNYTIITPLTAPFI